MVGRMNWWQAAGWGLAGGLAADVLGLMTAVTAAGFRWPWKTEEFEPRVFVVGGSLLLGVLVACAAHSQMSGGWPAFVMGAGAPATVQGLLSGVQVQTKPEEEQPATEFPRPTATRRPAKRMRSVKAKPDSFLARVLAASRPRPWLRITVSAPVARVLVTAGATPDPTSPEQWTREAIYVDRDRDAGTSEPIVRDPGQGRTIRGTFRSLAAAATPMEARDTMNISVQVPAEDPEALTALASELGLTPDDLIAARPFDGLIMLQILVPVSTAAISVLRKWIDARERSRSSYRIFVQGVEITGYTAAEAERILLALAEEAAENDD